MLRSIDWLLVVGLMGVTTSFLEVFFSVPLLSGVCEVKPLSPKNATSNGSIDNAPAEFVVSQSSNRYVGENVLERAVVFVAAADGDGGTMLRSIIFSL